MLVFNFLPDYPQVEMHVECLTKKEPVNVTCAFVYPETFNDIYIWELNMTCGTTETSVVSFDEFLPEKPNKS